MNAFVHIRDAAAFALLSRKDEMILISIQKKKQFLNDSLVTSGTI